ncbi:MAG: LytTR family transcriptional regulator DNA-binding domain-containing protein [Lachnospiraceae bacterium]|nr:LytTR family transcriptional regulator DNA-binding domain-containing protein [Lachnospiraceae bacterium]
MRLIKTKEENIAENYLELHYDKMDEETSAVLERLRGTLRYIEGICDEKKVTVAIADIYYIETVDRKTFAYTKDSCIEIKEALKVFSDDYSDAGFARVSKSSIVNIYKIKKLQGDINMRVIIFLKNDEKLVMNRSYKKEFYEKLKKYQGRKNK